MPGVIDSTTNYVEHPEVVANRICQAVEAIGDRSRVIASTDCGFGTFAGSEMVAESVVWVKLRALREGADLVQLGKKKLLFRRQPSYGRMTPHLQPSCHESHGVCYAGSQSA